MYAVLLPPGVNPIAVNKYIIYITSYHTIYHIRGLLEKYPTVFFLCKHLMDYNLARLHEPTLNLSAHA